MQITPWPIFPGLTFCKIVLPTASGNAGALHKFVRAPGARAAESPRFHGRLKGPRARGCRLSPRARSAPSPRTRCAPLPLQGGGLGWGSPVLAALLYVTIIPPRFRPSLLSSHAPAALDSGHRSQQTPRAVLSSSESMIPKKHAPDLIRGGYQFSEKIMLQ